jgi:hypothetical protein
MSNSKMLSEKFQKISKGKLTDAEIALLECHITKYDLGLQYRIILRYYELLIGSTYDKVLVSETIATALLSRIAPALSLKKVANSAKRQFTQILTNDFKRTPIARAFPANAKRDRIPVLLAESLESPALLVVSLLEILSGKTNVQLTDVIKSLLESVMVITFLRRCQRIIAQKSASNDEECLLYLTNIVKQYKLVSFDKSESLFEQIKMYGVNISIEQQVAQKSQEIKQALADINEIQEDYAKSKTRLLAQKKLRQLLKSFLR